MKFHIVTSNGGSECTGKLQMAINDSKVMLNSSAGQQVIPISDFAGVLSPELYAVLEAQSNEIATLKAELAMYRRGNPGDN